MKAPNLPVPTKEYSIEYMQSLLKILRTWFYTNSTPQPINLASINIDLRTLPTEADLATIRKGEVYRDTTADNALKVKV